MLTNNRQLESVNKKLTKTQVILESIGKENVE